MKDKIIRDEIYKKYLVKDATIVAGGPMMGNAIETDNFIIPNNLNSVIVLNKEEINETPCIRCGKCSDNCPAKISPVLVKDNIKNIEELKRLDVNRCIECGICSYLCPAKINLREFMRDAKKKVK